LTTLPPEIGALSSLVFLNLGGNPLSVLPHTFTGLVNLRILFFLRCKFTAVPELLGQMRSLTMLSFKANRVREVPAGALSPRLEWLILSDNQIEHLPVTVGACTGMRKLLLAGNRLTNQGLPDSMANLTCLELLRLADNRLQAIPDWILTHPALAWVALAANPATQPWSEAAEARAAASAAEGGGAVDVPEVPWADLHVPTGADPLGRGASGAVYAGRWENAPAAVKVSPGLGCRV
jgi:Leucine-rich repeat (LRR) protein